MDSPPRPDDVRTAAALFRVPPEEFTAARNRLVAELRRTGRASDAAALAKLPRPTPVIWAINQVAHRDRAAVDRLVAAADQLKRAQLGRGPADAQASGKAYREAVAALVEQGLAHLTEAGRATTAATRSRLTGTIMAAATDPALRDELRAGRLTRARPSGSFSPPPRPVSASGPPRLPRRPTRTRRRRGGERRRVSGSRRRARI
jgi:hypothetical protein